MSENEKFKSIWVVSSVDIRIHTDENGKSYKNPSRAWSFWESKEKAIEEGVFGWSGCEAFYESGYYTHVVVEEIQLNCPLHNYDIGFDNIFWFRIVPEEANKKDEDIRKSIVPCECPDEYKGVVGFY